METSHDNKALAVVDEKKRIREAAQDGFSDFAVHFGKGARKPKDSGGGEVNGADELRAEPRDTLIVPSLSI
jgi:hypothetical protein